MTGAGLLTRSGRPVSRLALGTVSLGVDYGIAAPGAYGRPAERDAIRVIEAAVEAGITLLDTAPAYGAAEEIVGRAVGDRDDVVVATKVSVGADVRSSVEASLRALRRETLDVVQIHNATEAVLADGSLAESLLALRDEGLLRSVGASVYTAAEAAAVVEAGCFDLLQLPFNLLDRRAEHAVDAARAAGVAVLVRSALLKGVLSGKALHLPAELAPLRDAADRARQAVGATWVELPAFALRFCLTQEGTSVLVGARTPAEVEAAVAAAAAGPLPQELSQAALAAGAAPTELLDPSSWSIA